MSRALRYECPACGARLQGGQPGAVLPCAECGSPVVVPQADATPPRPKPAAPTAPPPPAAPPFDAERARRKLWTTAGIVLAIVGVAHLGLYVLLTRDARKSMAEIEAKHDVAALERARAPAGESQPGSPDYKAWREAKQRWVDAESWRNDRRQVTLLKGGIIGSFVVQVAITGWILIRLLGNVRRRARSSS